VLLGCLLVACSASDSVANQGQANDRIAVATAGGEIYLIDPDGSNPLPLAGGDLPTGLQPVWSLDGRSIAWSEVGSTSNGIVTANPDGSNQRRSTTLFSGYFGYWDPTSTRLGFLGNAPPGTGLVIDDGSSATLDVVDSDTFYYFSWSPDGTRWVVHSGSGLHLMDLEGTRIEIDLDDAFFRAPVWTPDGHILLNIAMQGRNVIVRFDPATSEIEELLEVGLSANFVLDPTGNLLAVETVEEAGQGLDLGNDVTAISQPVSQPTGPSTRVLVYDLRSGSVAQAFDGPIGSAWWSPDGTTLALLVTEDSADPQFAQWLVWSRDRTFRTDRFVPTRVYATTYAPFYDQFAQSVSPWAPDSSRFVYAGTDVEGLTGLFVQDAESDTPATWIAADAAVAFWSPT